MVNPGVAVLCDTVLAQGKMLVSPTPGLREDKVLQQLVMNNQEVGKGGRQQKFLRKELDNDVKIDVLVVGSMLVDKTGRRMGKKFDPSGIEFVLGRLAAQEVVVITVVHDCQVVEHIPESFFSAMDVPVDIIVTPSRVIRVKDRLPKPRDIIWNKVTKRMLQDIPALKAVWMQDEAMGKNVELAPAGPVGRSRGNNENMKSNKEDKVGTGSKLKLKSLPREMKYVELNEALKGKVESGFKIGVLRFGHAVVYFKETADVVIEKLTGLEVLGNKVEIEDLDTKESEIKRKGGNEEAKVEKGKVEMKSKFTIENLGVDIKSGELKQALIARGVHYGFLKIFRKNNKAVVLFRESGDEVRQKIEGLIISDQKVLIKEVEMVEPRREFAPLKEGVRKSKEDNLKEIKSTSLDLITKDSEVKRKGDNEEAKVKKGKVEMKSKFTIENLGDDIKSGELKQALIARGVHYGFLKIFWKYNKAVVLFRESGDEVKEKIQGLIICDKEVLIKEVELVETKREFASSKEEVKKSKENELERLKEIKSKMKFHNLGNVKVSKLKESLRERNVKPGFIVAYRRFGYAIVLFKEISSEVVKKLKGLKVDDNEIEVKEIEFVHQRISGSKSVSEYEKKYEDPSIGSRCEKGLSGIFIGRLPRGATVREVKEAVASKDVHATHVKLIREKRIAFAYFDEPEHVILLNKLQDLEVRDHTCKVEVMRSPYGNSRPPPKDTIKGPETTGIKVKENVSTRKDEIMPSGASSSGIFKMSSSGDERKKIPVKESFISTDIRFKKTFSKGDVSAEKTKMKKQQVRTSRAAAKYRLAE